MSKADRTGFWASSHEFQKPSEEEHVAQMAVGITGNCTLVIQLRTLRLPRKEITMSLLVVSVATKPVTSEAMLFSNSESVVVFAGGKSQYIRSRTFHDVRN